MIKRSVLCMLFYSIIFSSCSLANSNLDERTSNDMDALRSEFSLPSLSVAISINDEIVFANAMGFSDVSKLRLANSQTQYSIGSLAKPMTGLALAKLVDQGKVDLEFPVSSYVARPSYTDSFSVEELAAHLAGIPHNTPERDIAEFELVKDHTSPFDAFYVFDKHPLLFSPGSEYTYSSNGYILLSALIERAANTSYVDFLRTSLWQAFEMNFTELDTSFAGLKREATYYADYTNKDDYTESNNKRDRSFLFGGGGFISTPTDLVKMARATFDPNFLSDDTRALLSKPVKLRNGELNSDSYSIGWRVGQLRLSDTDEKLWTVLHHGGVTDNASTSYLLVIPKCRAAIAFATNHVPEKFWQMRGKTAGILTRYVDKSDCSS